MKLKKLSRSWKRKYMRINGKKREENGDHKEDWKGTTLVPWIIPAFRSISFNKINYGQDSFIDSVREGVIPMFDFNFLCPTHCSAQSAWVQKLMTSAFDQIKDLSLSLSLTSHIRTHTRTHYSSDNGTVSDKYVINWDQPSMSQRPTCKIFKVKKILTQSWAKK